MASFRSEKGNIIARWDQSDWLRGLVPQSVDISNNKTYGDGLATASLVDPYRAPGAIYPWYTNSSYTNGATVDTIPVASVRYANKQYILSETSAGSVDVHEAGTGTVTATGSFPQEVVASGSGKVGGDAVLYHFNGVPYMLYSYNSTTRGSVGTYDFATTFNHDYWDATGGGDLNQADLNKDYPHPMYVSPRTGIAYVADKDKLKYIDGRGLAIGSADAGTSTFTIGEGFVITGFASHPNFMVVFAYSRRVGVGSSPQSTSKGRPVAFFWDEGTTKPSYMVELPGFYVGGGFTYKGFPATFSNDATKGYLCLVDTSSYQVLTQIDTTSSMVNGGVEVLDDDIYLNLGGSVYRYGSPILGGAALVTKLATVTSGSMFTYNLNGFTTYFSSALVRFSGGYQTSASFTTAFKQVPPSFYGKYKVKALRVYWVGNITSKIGINTLQLRYDNEDASSANESFTNFIAADTNTITDRTTYFYASSDGDRLPFVHRNIALSVVWSNSGTTDDAIGIEAVEVLLEPASEQ